MFSSVKLPVSLRFQVLGKKKKNPKQKKRLQVLLSISLFDTNKKPGLKWVHNTGIVAVVGLRWLMGRHFAHCPSFIFLPAVFSLSFSPPLLSWAFCLAASTFQVSVTVLNHSPSKHVCLDFIKSCYECCSLVTFILLLTTVCSSLADRNDLKCWLCHMKPKT